MPAFQAARRLHEYTQTNDAPPEGVFPLLCPVREAEWVPQWQYRMIHSQSGMVEQGCVFLTPEEDGSETIWQCTDYQPEAFRIAYAWVRPGLMTAQICIQLEPRDDGRTNAHIRYTYTALSEAGNAELHRMDKAWFEHKMSSWQSAINHYLRTGKLVDAAGWE
jgi:hypothetical protein